MVQILKKIDKFDFGWIVISFGMAVGAGIVLTPVSIGVVGLFIFLLAAIIAFPGTYLVQKIYIETLCANKEPKVYSEVITDYLGAKWGSFLSIVYFLMMVIWTIIYAEVVTESLASYLHIFGLTSNPNLDSNIIYSFFLILIMVYIGIKSQKLLVRVSSFLVIVLLLAIVVTSLVMIPLWSLENITYIPESNQIMPKTIVMIPFALTAILFMGSISPMVISYRLKYKNNPELAKLKAVSTMKFSFYILLAIVGFFILSFALVLPHDLAVEASKTNQSVFVILDKTHNSNLMLYICGIIINICAILTSFLSILAGMSESLRGILYKIFKLVKVESNYTQTNFIANIIMFMMIWLSVIFKFNVYFLVPLTGPIYCLVGCFIPVYLVYKIPALHCYKSKSLYFILFVGVMLAISPFLSYALA
ncbi:amino acid permease [Pseudofrancisella aestuarii]|uniref:Amino acid permease n=1 Tax=Pseudofrancisella aestuarii TaxID=2670347 RepID=A0ABV9TBH6_9GAMM|nr:aromatic amino acid transport family protein [Pseudofrancisella aestuarii]